MGREEFVLEVALDRLFDCQISRLVHGLEQCGYLASAELEQNSGADRLGISDRETSSSTGNAAEHSMY